MSIRSIVAIWVLALSAIAGAAATDHAGWFPFYMPWNDTSVNVVNQAWSVPRPAGAKGFLTTTPAGTFRFAESPERVRFSGFVSVAQANFPDSLDAPLIAGRLAKLGVNLMRVHLFDVDGVYGLFANATDTRVLDPIKLRKMDWFLKCLRDRGIYYNFCVQSGRVFKEGDSLRAPVTNDQSKYVSLFDPRLKALEKEFAASIARHVNPYTGLSYAQDPAVATWELTNENQLYLGWLSWGSSSWDSATAAHPTGMAPASYRYLDTLWNLWLAKRYGTDSVLAAAWSSSGGSGVNQIANASFEANLGGWTSWSDPATDASIRVARTTAKAFSGKASLSVTVLSQGTNSYDASVIKQGLSASAGRSYRLRWFAKTDTAGSLRAEFMKETEWTWYGATDCAVDTGWTSCEAYVTVPEDLAGNLRFNLNFGTSHGTWWIDSVVFGEYAGDGLRPAEHLADISIKRSSRAGIGAISSSRASDESRLYGSVESTYVAELSGYLKNDLGIRVPVTFTNNWFGTASIASQARSDYMDGHWYWDHPSFPNGWSDIDYSMRNVPMVRDAAGSTASAFCLSRVAGKPFVSSEYNHPWPNEYQSEVMALDYAWLGFLDADGGLLHAYADYDVKRYKLTYLEQFFNAGLNPILMSQMGLARVFRTGGIAPTRSWNGISLTDSSVHADARLRKDGRPTLPARGLLQTPTRWEDFHASADRMPVVVDPGSDIASNTGELHWNETKGIFKVDNAHWQGAVGFLSEGTSTSRLMVRSFRTTGGFDFGAIHLIGADSAGLGTGHPMLLLASARVENRGTIWNSARSALTTRFGTRDTVLCEPVKALVGILPGRRDSVSVWSLGPTGERVKALAVGWSGDTLWVELSGTSLWYEVASAEASSPLTGVSVRAPRGATLVPGAKELRWTLSEGAGGLLVLKARNPQGRVLAQSALALAGRSGVVPLPTNLRGIVFWEAVITSGQERSTRAWSSLEVP